MIPIALLAQSKKEAIKLVREVGLLGNFNSKMIYPANMPGDLRPLSYADAWKKCKLNSWFDIELDDSSLLIFKQDGYSYIRTPISSLSFEGFAQEFYEEDPEWKKEENSHVIAEEYEKYIESQQQFQPPMPVRFDIDVAYYCEHIHPLYHFHFGIGNESRIPSNRELTPISFVGFILRTFYPKEWKVFSESQNIGTIIRLLKRDLKMVPKEYWKSCEPDLFYLG